MVNLDRILSGWTWNRFIYLVLGGAVVLHSAVDQEWAGVLIGGYFAAMGLFNFGCAGGYCAAVKPQNSEQTKVSSQPKEPEKME